jgi:hypothetical protein
LNLINLPFPSWPIRRGLNKVDVSDKGRRAGFREAESEERIEPDFLAGEIAA